MAGGCLLLIYSSLYIARPITEWLREANLLRVAVGVSFLAVAVWVALRLRRMRSGWRGWLTLGGIAGFYQEQGLGGTSYYLVARYRFK